MTVSEALRKIIIKEGAAILESPNRVQSMIMDYSSDPERDVQLFCLACQKGLLFYGRKLLSNKDNDEVNDVAFKAKAKDIAIKAKDMLQKDAFMDEIYAIKSVNLLLSGLGIPVIISTDTPKTNKIDLPENGSIGEKAHSNNYSVQVSDHNEIVFDGRMIHDLMIQERKGNVSAMMSLGNCYFHGIAVAEDWIIAESYYRKALALGNDNERREAANRINEIYNRRQANL